DWHCCAANHAWRLPAYFTHAFALLYGARLSSPADAGVTDRGAHIPVQAGRRRRTLSHGRLACGPLLPAAVIQGCFVHSDDFYPSNCFSQKASGLSLASGRSEIGFSCSAGVVLPTAIRAAQVFSRQALFGSDRCTSSVALWTDLPSSVSR